MLTIARGLQDEADELQFPSALFGFQLLAKKAIYATNIICITKDRESLFVACCHPLIHPILFSSVTRGAEGEGNHESCAWKTYVRWLSLIGRFTPTLTRTSTENSTKDRSVFGVSWRMCEVSTVFWSFRWQSLQHRYDQQWKLPCPAHVRVELYFPSCPTLSDCPSKFWTG